jgi:hypothetical protein
MIPALGIRLSFGKPAALSRSSSARTSAVTPESRRRFTSKCIRLSRFAVANRGAQLNCVKTGLILSGTSNRQANGEKENCGRNAHCPQRGCLALQHVFFARSARHAFARYSARRSRFCLQPSGAPRVASDSKEYRPSPVKPFFLDTKLSPSVVNRKFGAYVASSSWG